jgi:murein L,D-transpeptidase YcbB/YkuD
MTRIARLLLAIVLLPSLAALAAVPVPAAVPGAVAAEQAGAVDVAIAARLVDDSRLVAGQSTNLTQLRRFYAQRGFEPVWRDLAPVQALLAVLRDAESDGLSLADYHIDSIAGRLEAAGMAERVELELLLSDAAMAYGAHLRAGRVVPRMVSSDLAVTPQAVDVFALAEGLARSSDPAAVLAALRPVRPEYTALKALLARYKAVEKAGGWPVIRAGRDPGLKDLRRRLAATGDLDARAAAGGGDAMDPAVRKAVETFQARHGLTADGSLNAATLAALNVPVADRIAQVVVNMERARWMPEDFGDRYVLVNIPDFTLKAVDNGKVALDMRVIVGTKVRRTPIFDSSITSVMLNPTWTVPVKLAREDYLPKLMADPGFLASHGFTVYSGWGASSAPMDGHSINWRAVGAGGIARLRLRQDPGPNNALGQVLFSIPNDFDVYLHDTPSREKFSQTIRSFSSGCVRVGNPWGLADFVMAGMPEGSPDRRKAILDKRTTRIVTLRQAIPVHLHYQTVWADAAGVVQVRDDVYGRDAELLDAIARRAGPTARVADAHR